MAEPYRLHVVVLGRPSMNQKRHWRKEAKERATWRHKVCAAISPALRPIRPLRRAAVHFACWRNGNEPDRINLAHSCKSLLDSLQPPKTRRGKNGQIIVAAGAGVILDDSPAHCVDSYSWHRAKRGEDRVEITVEELE